MKEFDDQTQFGRLMIAANAKYPTIELVADLAKHLSVDQQVLYNWSRRGIPAGKIDNLAEMFDCEPKWLKSKIGAMKISNPYALVTKREKDIAEFSNLLRQLDDDDFQQVKSTGQNIAVYLIEKKQDKNGD